MWYSLLHFIDLPEMRKLLLFILLAVTALLAFQVYESERTRTTSNQDEIARIKADIRTNFQNQGFIVGQVRLVKQSDRRLTGFVRVRRPTNLLFNLEFTMNCVATMGADSGGYNWECK